MRYLYFIPLLLLVLSGCGGGGGGNPLNIRNSGDLTFSDGRNNDGSLYDNYTFRATRDGWIQVTMSSTELDSYIVVYEGQDEGKQVGYDDDSGSDGDAIFVFWAYGGETFTAKFTTYGSGAITGHYKYSIKEITGDRLDTRATEPADTGKAPVAADAKRAKKK